MQRFTLLLLFLLCSGFLAESNAEQYCSENWACAGNERDNKGVVTYWIANKEPFPITVTLEVKTSNLKNAQGKVRKRWEITQVLKGYEKVNVLELYRIVPKIAGIHSYDFHWIPGDMNAVHNDGYFYQLPFSDNKDYRVVQGFNGGYSHRGASKYAMDFAMPVGTPVHAAREGTVIDLKKHNWRGGASRQLAKYSNFIVILHPDGTTGEYYHLKQNGVTVNIGDSIKAGQQIGYSGNTGFSSLPHLHFAVYRASSHGKYESLPISFIRQPNTWRRRGLGNPR